MFDTQLFTSAVPRRTHTCPKPACPELAERVSLHTCVPVYLLTYTNSPQNYRSSPQKSQKIHENYSKMREKYSKMNEKYAEKPIPNPNEPIKAICGKLDAARKTNPIFSRPNMHY
jgi:hypothetical protein